MQAIWIVMNSDIRDGLADKETTAGKVINDLSPRRIHKELRKKGG
jgi:hypothetical protein